MDEEQNEQFDEFHPCQVHVRNDGRPLCRQSGECLTLADIKEFKQAQGARQCFRCRRALGIERYPGEHRIPLSLAQRRLIKAISKRTQEPGQWVTAAEILEDKSSSGRSSLHRSLRRLKSRNYIEMRTTDKGRAEVRLIKLDAMERSGKI